ncbi:diguanylate cyclase [Marinobacter daqiaonensis]|uniref:diguanylate cyclase n=1 Tax=Marinobacter daqiaonensis TaxID=650891 RepID=UPI000B83FCEB|nr:diguanylate cyclase [Marinobacter daqiaonensis]
MSDSTPLSPKTRLTAINDGTLAGTWEWNLGTGEVIINNRWAEMLGYTMSCGVVAWQKRLGSIRELLALSDQSLYDAKKQGRNQVVIATQD